LRTFPMNNTTDTTVPTENNESILIAYSAIVSMAIVPIWMGSFQSLKRKEHLESKGQVEEKMSKRDAYMFPVIGSGVLIGLYILFRLFSKEYVNMLLTCYFLFLGFFSLYETAEAFIRRIVPWLDTGEFAFFSYRLPWESSKTDVPMTKIDLVAGVVSFLTLFWYSVTKHWIANNILGLAFSVQGVAMITLPSYQVGCILLGGLFFYDIFWVFGTDVMVTVAKSFDAPIKLLFPKNIFAAKYQFSMLGLGDIVIPGIFVALLLRFDVHRASKMKESASRGLSNPLFVSTFIGYTLGLIGTIIVMHTFQAAKPALLYLVPAVIGFSSCTAYFLGELNNLLAFESGSPTQTKDTPEKKTE